MNARIATSFSSLSFFLSAIADNVILGIYCRTLATATSIVIDAHIGFSYFVVVIAHSDFMAYNTCIGGSYAQRKRAESIGAVECAGSTEENR